MLTPEEIASRQFAASLRGYDRDEVTAFLREVADEHARLVERLRGLERELQQQAGGEADRPADAAAGTSIAPAPSAAVAAQGAGLANTREVLSALGEETTRVLVAAEESAQAIRDKAEERARAELEEARRQAREEVEGARRNGSALVAEAERQRDGIAEEIRALEAARDRLVDDLRAAMEGVQGAVQGMRTLAIGAGTPAADEDDAPGEPARALAGAPVDAQPATEAGAEPDAASDVESEAGWDPTPWPEVEAEPEADTESAPGEAEPSEAVVEPVVASEPPAAEPDGEVGASAAVSTDPLELREQSLSGVRPGMLRRLKRALQDVQNGVLDALRKAGDQPDVDALLPSDDDLAPLGAVGQMFLTAAYRAGIADGAILSGREVSDAARDESRIPAAAATFRAVTSHEITAALRATLRAGVEAGEPETSLSERVGEVFRDLKGPVVEQTVDQQLARVYGFGQLDAWRSTDVAASRWILGDEPRCPANRCRLNSQEGAVGLRDEYPSGDAVPPAHDGCTCGLAPA